MAKTVGMIVMMAYVLIGAGYFVREIVLGQVDVSFWQIYLTSFAAVYGVFAGTDSFFKHTKSKYYHPEMDDAHPEVQRKAIGS